jgi:hypothetical protein
MVTESPASIVPYSSDHRSGSSRWLAPKYATSTASASTDASVAEVTASSPEPVYSNLKSKGGLTVSENTFLEASPCVHSTVTSVPRSAFSSMLSPVVSVSPVGESGHRLTALDRFRGRFGSRGCFSRRLL